MQPTLASRRARWACATMLVVASVIARSAFAQACDCTQVTGKCDARIQVTPTGDHKGGYGADLLIQANAPACAKVEYYVGTLPAFTILANGKRDTDRVMGTSDTPLSRRDVTLDACRVCKTAAQVASEQAQAERMRAAQAAAEQAEVERLVGDAASGGRLQPAVQGSSPDMIDVVTQLQMQLAEKTGSLPRPGASAQKPSTSPARRSNCKEAVITNAIGDQCR